MMTWCREPIGRIAPTNHRKLMDLDRFCIKYRTLRFAHDSKEVSRAPTKIPQCRLGGPKMGGRGLLGAMAASSILMHSAPDSLAFSGNFMDAMKMEQMLEMVTKERENLYTPEVIQGLQYLKEYELIVEKNEQIENQCSECATNRGIIERAWQVVSNEFFSPRAEFSQSEWACRLLETIRDKKIIRSKEEAYAIVRDLVASLGDPYSQFLPPDAYRIMTRRSRPEERSYMAAIRTGVGIEIGGRCPDGSLQVIAPYASSPAEQAGIRPGESLLSVDGFPTSALSKDEVLAVLRGPSGSNVSLEVRDIDGNVRTVDLDRRKLLLSPLDVRFLDDDRGREIAYLRMRYFSSIASRALEKALQECEYRGVDAIVLDLRNNPGGVFEESIADSALFLEDRYNIVSTVRSYNETAALRRNPHAIFIQGISRRQNVVDNEYFAGSQEVTGLTKVPMSIIINKGSASASEVLAGALHDHRRARLVGERSFGKGVVQYFFPLGDGSGLKLTVAKYVTPAGHDISLEGGLEPDFVCKDFPHKLPTGRVLRLDMNAGGPRKYGQDVDKCILLASKLAR